LLINDWQVHHLQLSLEVQSDGFVKRTGPLLFGVFVPRNAYLIDIVEHGGWTREHVLTTIAKEWPDAGIVHEVKGALGLARQHADEERKVLRSNAINVFFEYGGKVYMPAGGLSTAGTSIAATMSADRVLRSIEWFWQEIQTNPDWIKNELTRIGVEVAFSTPVLKLGGDSLKLDKATCRSCHASACAATAVGNHRVKGSFGTCNALDAPKRRLY
jgi:hypothetical protein